jgi:hypothetical protein
MVATALMGADSFLGEVVVAVMHCADVGVGGGDLHDAGADYNNGCSIKKKGSDQHRRKKRRCPRKYSE